MPTCGDCKFGVTGRCQDTKPSTGKPWDMIVRSTSYACSTRRSDSEEYADGERGFTPKEEPDKQQAITTLGQLLKKKLDLTKKCGTCDKFKSPGEPCGEMYEMQGKQHAYRPADPAFGPCQNGWVEKKIRLRPPQLVLKSNLCQEIVMPMDSSGSMTQIAKAFLLPETKQYQPYKPDSTTTTKKETSIMSNAIIRLADSQLNKQIEDFGGLSLDIRGALNELQDAERKESAKQAAQEIVSLLKVASASVEFQVKEIRRARRLEESAKKSIAELARAKAYGLETNNFIPLGVLLGHVYEHNVENKDLLKVPADWQPKKAEVATEAAAQ